MRWLRRLSMSSRTRNPRPAASFRPALETLEERTVPTVTYRGGPLLTHVEVQGVYYGSDFATPAYQPLVAQTEGFLGYIVNSPYMDMLTNAGYGVGRGSDTPGKVIPTALDKSRNLTDRAIQRALQQQINNGTLAAPDANRLYVVYVEDGVVVKQGLGNSHNMFLGYHNDFAGTDAQGHAMNIYYAVIPYQARPNAHIHGLSEFDSATEVTSHELAEAVTDPVPGTGWYDTQQGEIGDITNQQGVRLNGYAVQKVANQQDQPIAPAGATSLNSSASSADPSPGPTSLAALAGGHLPDRLDPFVTALDGLFVGGY